MAVSIDQQFIEYIVKSLVNNPDKVEIKRTIDEKGVLLELTVDAEDLGRVIGKRGATAQSLRTLLRALGTKNDARYNLKIVDVGDPRPPRQPRDDRRDDNHPSDDVPADEPAALDQTATDAAPVDDAIGASDVEDDQGPEVVKDRDSDVVSRTRAELAELDDLDV
jgi:predicted RNA-binding protein YlqC (UPF0109 family)